MADEHLETLQRRLRVGDDVLAPLHDLAAADRAALAATVHEAIDRRDAELRDAIEQSLTMVPRPLRRIVSRIVGG